MRCSFAVLAALLVGAALVLVLLGLLLGVEAAFLAHVEGGEEIAGDLAELLLV